jgi:hypothetical protein
VETPQGNRLFGRHRRRLEDNIKIDFKDIVWVSVDLLHLAQGRDWQAFVYTVMNLRVS